MHKNGVRTRVGRIIGATKLFILFKCQSVQIGGLKIRHNSHMAASGTGVEGVHESTVNFTDNHTNLYSPKI